LSGDSKDVKRLVVDPLSKRPLSYEVSIRDLQRFPLVRSGCIIEPFTRSTGCEMVAVRRHGETILTMDPGEARELARVLIAAADLADGTNTESGR
jgi:hypothetical protein